MRPKQQVREFKRAERVNSLLKEELSRLVMRELSDPRIGEITITEVVTSDDLRHAKVYYATHPSEDERLVETSEGLSAATGFLRGKLGRALRMKRTPELRFLHDTSLDYGEHIDSVLRGLISGAEDE